MSATFPETSEQSTRSEIWRSEKRGAFDGFSRWASSISKESNCEKKARRARGFISGGIKMIAAQLCCCGGGEQTHRAAAKLKGGDEQRQVAELVHNLLLDDRVQRAGRDEQQR